MPRKWGKGDLKAPKATPPPKVPKSGSKDAEEPSTPTSSNSKGATAKSKSGITKDQISAPVMVEKKGEGILSISSTKPDAPTVVEDNPKDSSIPETKMANTETKPEESVATVGFPKLKKWEPKPPEPPKSSKWKPPVKVSPPTVPPENIAEAQKHEKTKSNQTPQSDKLSDGPQKLVDVPKPKVPSILNTAKEKFASMEKVEMAKTTGKQEKESDSKTPNPVQTEAKEKPKTLNLSKFEASQEKVEPTTHNSSGLKVSTSKGAEAKSQSKDDKVPSATKSNSIVEQSTECINEKPNPPRSEPSRVEMWKDKFEAPKLNKLGRRFSSKEELSNDEPPKFGSLGRRMSESSKDLWKPLQKDETSKFGTFGRRLSSSREELSKPPQKEELPKFGTFGRRLSSSREELSKASQKEEPPKFSTFGRRLSSSREELSKPDDLKEKQALQSKIDIAGDLPKIEEVQAKLEVATPEPPRKQTAKDNIKPEKVSPIDAAKEKLAGNTSPATKLSPSSGPEKVVSPFEAAKGKLAGNASPASKLDSVKDKFEAPKVSKFGSRVSQPKDEPQKPISNVTANEKIPKTVETKAQSVKESVTTKVDSDKDSAKNKLGTDKDSIKKTDSKVESNKLPLTDLKVTPEEPKSCLKKTKVSEAKKQDSKTETSGLGKPETIEQNKQESKSAASKPQPGPPKPPGPPPQNLLGPSKPNAGAPPPPPQLGKYKEPGTSGVKLPGAVKPPTAPMLVSGKATAADASILDAAKAMIPKSAKLKKENDKMPETAKDVIKEEAPREVSGKDALKAAAKECSKDKVSESPKVKSKDSPDALKAVSKDIAKDKAINESPNVAQKALSKNVSNDLPKETTKGVPKDSPKELQKDTSKVAQKETSKMPVTGVSKDPTNKPQKDVEKEKLGPLTKTPMAEKKVSDPLPSAAKASEPTKPKDNPLQKSESHKSRGRDLRTEDLIAKAKELKAELAAAQAREEAAAEEAASGAPAKTAEVKSTKKKQIPPLDLNKKGDPKSPVTPTPPVISTPNGLGPDVPHKKKKKSRTPLTSPPPPVDAKVDTSVAPCPAYDLLKPPLAHRENIIDIPSEKKMSAAKAKKKGRTRTHRYTSNVFSMFNQAQIQEFKEAFNIIDQNRDGFIDKEDLIEMLTSLGKNPTDPYLDMMVCEAPGPINFTMFLTLFGEKLQGTDPEDVIKNAFACFDDKRMGQLNEDYLRELMTSMGDRWSDDMVDELFIGAPIAGGLFDYMEFIKTLKHGAKDKDEEAPPKTPTTPSSPRSPKPAAKR